MAIGLSTSGTLFGIRAAEQTILTRPGRNPGYTALPELDANFSAAVFTLLRATAAGTYRIPPPVAYNLGDTGTHEVGHVFQAEQTILSFLASGRQPANAHSTFWQACVTLLLATAGGAYQMPANLAQAVKSA